MSGASRLWTLISCSLRGSQQQMTRRNIYLMLGTAALSFFMSMTISAFIPSPNEVSYGSIVKRSFVHSSFKEAQYGRIKYEKTVLHYSSDDDDEQDSESPPMIEGFDLDESDSSALSEEVLMSMTVTQLKQQLRLRGKKVSGSKVDLVNRLLTRTYDGSADDHSLPNIDDNNSSPASKESKRVADAKAKGARIIDVTEFVDAEEVGKSFRSSNRHKDSDQDGESAVNGSDGMSDDSSSSAEVWGEDARIIEDFEGRSVVVDGLSRTVIEYKGANDTIVQAYVVASRESLGKFLRGGRKESQEPEPNASDQGKDTEKRSVSSYASIEEEVFAIQRKREIESRRGLIRDDEIEGSEDADDPGTVYNTIERDYGDWGVYTPTGAQLSSSEVQGVLLLSDVNGPFHSDTQSLADKIAFECQPVVVLVPDLFRGKPWSTHSTPTPNDDGKQLNDDGKTYEEWRAMHPERRVDIDIRAAAAVLRERYAVSSIAVWGTCFGGGRALEVAAGWYPGGAASYYEDAFSDRPPPPHVDPVACIAWYPTRYDAKKLFGNEHEGFRTFENGKDRSVAVMAIFAENDALPGATIEDAMILKTSLEEDSRVKDLMVKVFPNQNHGFAHKRDASEENEDFKYSVDADEDSFGSMNREISGSDAEVACLLSTAWMETYTRIFLPTVGSPVRYDEDETWRSVKMKELSESGPRDIRKELELAIANYEDVEIDFRRMPQSSSPLIDKIPEQYEQIEEEREKRIKVLLEKYEISPDNDDDPLLEKKLKRAFDEGALDGVVVDAYLDDSGDAYW